LAGIREQPPLQGGCVAQKISSKVFPLGLRHQAAAHFQGGSPGMGWLRQAIHEEDYDRQQLLVVDRATFEAWCTDNHFQPFWIVCQYQSPSLNQKARSEGLYFTNFRYWLVWEDAGGIQQHLYHDGQYRDKQAVPAGDEEEQE
nr:hypothetical protein [Tanacetum cinerariifolium]